jgi:predicted MFS family arabinose efflux permease
LIELSLFRLRSFAAGMPMVAIGQVSNAGMYFVLTLYLQEGRGLSPGMAGLLFAPNGLAYMCLAPLSPRIARRYGRPTMVLGYLVMATAITSIVVLLHFYGAHGSPFLIMPSIGLIGAGQSLVNSPLYGTVLFDTPAGHEGSASGILATTQQSGSAIGVATEGLLFFTALGASATLTGHIPAAAAAAAYGRTLFFNVGLMLLMALLVLRLPRVFKPKVAADPGPVTAEALGATAG